MTSVGSVAWDRKLHLVFARGTSVLFRSFQDFLGVAMATSRRFDRDPIEIERLRVVLVVPELTLADLLAVLVVDRQIYALLVVLGVTLTGERQSSMQFVRRVGTH